MTAGDAGGEARPWSTGRAALAVLAVSICFATSGPLARVAAPADPMVVACGRTGLAAAVLLAVAPRRAAAAVRAAPAAVLARTFGAGALLAAHFWMFLAGVAATSLPAAVTLVSLEPVAVVLTAWAVFGARPARGEALGVALATAGALVMVLATPSGGGAGGRHTLAGDALVLGAVALYGLYLAAARALTEVIPAGVYAALVYGAASATLALGVAAGQGLGVAGALGALPARSWWAIVALGVVPTLCGHTLVQWASRHVPAAVVALVSPGETVGSLLIAAALLGEPPRGAEWAGAALVLLGVVATLLARRAPAARVVVGSQGRSPPP